MLFASLKPLGFDLTRFDAPLMDVLIPYLYMYFGLKAAFDFFGNPCTSDRPAGTKAFFRIFHGMYNFIMALVGGFVFFKAFYGVVWEVLLNSGKGGVNFTALTSGGVYTNANVAQAGALFVEQARWTCFANGLLFLFMNGGGFNDAPLLSHFRAVVGYVAYAAAHGAKADWMWFVVLLGGARRFLRYGDRANAAATERAGIAGMICFPEALPVKKMGAWFNKSRNQVLFTGAQMGLMLLGGAGSDAWTLMATVTAVELYNNFDAELKVMQATGAVGGKKKA